MLDGFTLALIQSLCKDWKWRFNSSKTQIKNGTISIISNGKVWEIASNFQIRERLPSKQPCPCYPTECRVKNKLSNASDYLNAMKILHDFIDDGDDNDNPCIDYLILYKTSNDTSYVKVKTKDLKEAKKFFKNKCIAYGVNKQRFFWFDKTKDVCIMLIEMYNGTARLLNIKNTIVARKDIDAKINSLSNTY